MKILFITASLGYGGASKMLCFVADSLTKRGHEILVANLNSTGDNGGYNRKLSGDIKIYDIKSEKKRGIRRFDQMNQIKKISKEHSVNVLIGFTHYPNLMAQIIGKQLHIPAIISERGDPNRTFGTDMLSKISRSIINHADGAVFQTKEAGKFYSNRLQSRGTVIPNPIFSCEVIPYVDATSRNKTVVSVGRLDNIQKRYDIMLKAFQVFSEKHPEYILKLYGTGSDENLIHQWCEDLHGKSRKF